MGREGLGQGSGDKQGTGPRKQWQIYMLYFILMWKNTDVKHNINKVCIKVSPLSTTIVQASLIIEIRAF